MKSLLILFVTTFQLIACSKAEDKNKGRDNINQGDDTEIADDQERYIVFFLTNTSVNQADNENTGKDANKKYSFVAELPQLFGAISAQSPYKYAFGLPGPMLLTQSIQEMQYQVNTAFDIAERHNVPVYFQLDDINNYTKQFGDGSSPKFYNNPAWSEWSSFPRVGEMWGGQSNGRLPYYWFNWGNWMHADAFPNLESEGFRAFVKNQLEKGVLSVLNARYDALKSRGKGYLFAGMAIGWETHIPDYSSDNTLYNVDPTSLPINILEGDQMQSWEAGKLGYAALHTLGYSTYDKERLYQVIHDYSEFLSKIAFDSGIPKEKIFTHIVGLKSSQPDLATTFAPPIWTAVNKYSTPGFTLSPISSPYNLNTLVSEIQLADKSQKRFANAEGYSIGVDNSFAQADAYFGDMFGHGASLVTVFGWGREAPNSAFVASHSTSSPFVQAAQKWLSNEVKMWSFLKDTEGWTVGQHINDFGTNNNGRIIGKVTDKDAFILTSDTIAYNTLVGGKLQLGLANTTSNKIGKVYFITAASPDWSEDKSKDFTIFPNSSLTNYEIDLSSLPTWQGTLKQFRFILGDSIQGTSTIGNYSVDYIHLNDLNWDFQTNLQGWIGERPSNELKWASWSGGFTGGSITGADAHIISPDSLNFEITNSRYVSIRIKNATAQSIGQIYFTTTADTLWDDNKHVSFEMRPYSDYYTYTIDVSTLDSWAGTLKQLRIDPSNALPGTPATGFFEIDEIKIIN